jgi:hypothetical protein
MNDKEGDKVVLPSPHDPQVLLNIAPLTVASKIQIQHRREPILRGPRLEGIFLSGFQLRSKARNDILIIMLVRNDKGINKCCKDKK